MAWAPHPELKQVKDPGYTATRKCPSRADYVVCFFLIQVTRFSGISSQSCYKCFVSWFLCKTSVPKVATSFFSVLYFTFWWVTCIAN